MESTIPEKLGAPTPALPLSRDLLIDTGLGRTIASQFHTMPGWFRAMTSYITGSDDAYRFVAHRT
jgi:hypothetical protein